MPRLLRRFSDMLVNPQFLRKILTTAAPTCYILFVVSIIATAAILNQVVAVVNGDIITEKELEQLLRPLYAKYKKAYSDQELIQKIEKARREAIEQLIDRRLIVQEAKSQKIDVAEKEIDRRLRQLKSHFDDEEMFYYAMQRENMNIEELRENLREQIMVQKLTRKEIRKGVNVTPLEVGQYYQHNIEKFHEPDKVSALHILVKKTLTQ